MEAAGCRLLFLPAYSPDFNPIELAFAKIKQHLRGGGSAPCRPWPPHWSAPSMPSPPLMPAASLPTVATISPINLVNDL